MHRKLSLDLESLSVSSFDTGEGQTLRGTVDAHEAHVACPVSKTDSCAQTAIPCRSIDISCRQ
jgi:hypothetical protein